MEGVREGRREGGREGKKYGRMGENGELEAGDLMGRPYLSSS